MPETSYTVTVMDSDRRRRRPPACHEGLTCRAAFEVAAVYAALGHAPSDIAISHAEKERAS